MSTIWLLTKKGKSIKTKIKESISEIWCKMNGEYGENTVFNDRINREYILLTDNKGKPLIFHTRYMWKITE